MSFPAWDERQIDFANYFNPAYLGIIVYEFVKGYNGTKSGMSLALAFPGVVMVLHPDIRVALPRAISTRLSKWLRDNPEVRANLLSSTQLLVPQVREAVLTSLRSEWILAKDGLLHANANGPTTIKFGKAFDDDRKAATFVGKWFAKSGDERQLYQNVGLRP